jgi:cytochrome c oxidase cbb3-type subunit III
MKMINLFIVLLFVFNSGFILADQKDYPANYYDTIAILFLLVIALILIAFIFYGTGEGKPTEAVKRKTLLQNTFINRFITGTVPIEKEHELLLNDDYDGIKELDNKVPPWFNYLFYGSILFSVYYMLDYHVFESSPLQEAEYAMEMEAAKLQREQLAKSGAFITEETVTFVQDTEALSKGKQLYDLHCVTCHAPDGGGSIGPNLADRYWIHGGTINDIFRTVKYGVPSKGMIPWQQQLNPVEIQQVSSYVLSMQGSVPQNPKGPEGDPFPDNDTLKTLSLR